MTLFLSFQLFSDDSCDNKQVGVLAENQEVLQLINSAREITTPERCSLGLQYNEENPAAYQVMKRALEFRGYTVHRYNSDTSRENYFNVFPNTRCSTQYAKCYVSLSLHFFNDPYETGPDKIDSPAVNLSYDFKIDPAASDDIHRQEVLDSLANKMSKKFLKCNSLHRVLSSAKSSVMFYQSNYPEVTRRYRRNNMQCRIVKSFQGFDRPVCL